MGRPTKHPRDKRIKQIIAKVTEDEKAKVVKQARRKRLTESELLRRAIGL